jgi:hypothetical protein
VEAPAATAEVDFIRQAVVVELELQITQQAARQAVAEVELPEQARQEALQQAVQVWARLARAGL